MHNRFYKTNLMKRKSGSFVVFTFLFVLILFCIPYNNGSPEIQGPLPLSRAGEARANVFEAAAPKDTPAADTAAEMAGIQITVQNASAEHPIPGPVADTATIIFTFDDGYISDYALAYPILRQYGIRGTSYIIPKYQDNGTANALTWDMVKEMKQYGWVFGCHTYAHSDLKKMTADAIKTSMRKVNESFIAQGLESPAIHAFPFGFYDQEAIEAMKPFRIQMRKAFYECKFVDPKTADPYEVDCCSADMRSEKRLKEHEALVDKAIKQKAIIVFRCHCLYKESVDDMGDWPVQTDSRLFKKLVKYCVDKGCRFMTMLDLAKACSENGKP